MKIRLLSVHCSIPVLAARRFLPAIAIVLLACLAVLPWRAAAAVFDDFESYAAGSNLHGQGGWAGWAGDTNAGALVSSNFSFSPTRSVNITGASDLVRTFSGATNGQWVFSVMQYIPSTSTGTNYVSLLNTYRSPYGPADLNYSVQIRCNMATGQIISDFGGGATRPMVKDQWVEVRCEINLAANSVSEFYNGQLLSTHAWQGGTGGTGLNHIQALDLYANNAGPAYCDDVSLAPPGLPPVITTQPQSLRSVIGSNVTFSVTATGTRPLSYQWLLNGAAIPGTTNATYSITNVQASDAGPYAARVTNVFGAVTSSPALLSVSVDIHVWVRNGTDFANAQTQLQQHGALVLEATEFFKRFTCRIDSSLVAAIASLGFVRAVEPVRMPVLFNLRSRYVDNVINVQALPWGIPNLFNLTGQGVHIGVWDGGMPNPAPDFGARVKLIENTGFGNSIHPTHVIGTMIGDGSFLPSLSLAGMAPEAEAEAWNFSSPPDPSTKMLAARTQNPALIPTLIPPLSLSGTKIDLSQNSWGLPPSSLGTCNLFGSYLNLCGDYDQLVRVHALPIFFAAANSQNGYWYTCCPFATGPCPASATLAPPFGTVTPYGTAKNVVTVGAIDDNNVLTTFSSCGPTQDGRLKPDVVALGLDVTSTTVYQSIGTLGFPWWYGPLSGTSMATPAVSGTAALLIEQFRKPNPGTDPTPALLKAVLCNTATDLGNPGPDFKYGYGVVNAVAAATTLKNNQYCDHLTGLNDSEVWTYLLQVTVACPELKVLIAWSDYEYTGDNSSTAQAAPRLVNDLDLVVTGPSGPPYPYTLNPISPSLAATTPPTGNHLDNVEQVVIPNPLVGTYTIQVTGHSVPIATGPQLFAVTWWTNCPAAPPCPSQPIPGLFNTGVDGSGNTLPTGAIDPNYILSLEPGPFNFGPLVWVWFNVNGLWLSDVGDPSKWISPAGSLLFARNGTYVYKYLFDLPNCADPATAQITGRWSCDDVGDIKLNGNLIKSTLSEGFGVWTPFTLTGGFVPGQNVLEFWTQNIGGAPTGIRVELAGTYCPVAVPIQTTVSLNNPSVCEGQPATFTAVPGGNPPFTYVWTHNNTTIAGANGQSLTIAAVSAADAGTYCVTVTGACGTAQQCATLNVLLPTTATPLNNLSVCEGLSATFATTPGGAGPFTYVWTHNNTTIAGANGQSLTIAAVSAADAGTYCVTVTGACGTAQQCATLNVLLPTTATPLTSQSVCEGQSATFTTTAGGAGPFTYVWTHNNTTLAGANAPSLTIAPVSAAGAGTYCVTVTGACGTAQQCATLVVLATTPVIDCPPDIVVDCDTNSGAFVNYSIPTATSACCPGPVFVSCFPPPGWFSIGTTVVTCGSIDSCTNTAQCCFSVVVRGHGYDQWTWARQAGGPNSDSGNAVAVDKKGNVFVTGSYQGLMNFPPPNPNVVAPLIGFGGNDIFLAKYDAAGRPLWAVRAGGTGQDAGYGVAVDADGNAYITGEFTDTATFESYPTPPGTPAFNLTAIGTSGGSDIFVAKYDPSGTCLWASRRGGLGSDLGAGIAVTANGLDVFVTGNWGVAGRPEAFVLRLLGTTGVQPVGVGPPAISSGPPGQSAQGRAIAIDISGVPYVTGVYEGKTTFAGCPPLPPFGAPGAFARIFVAKFKAALPVANPCIWATHSSMGNATGNHDGRGIAVDPTGPFCYVTAYFNGKANFGQISGANFASVVNTKGPGSPPGNQLYDYLIVKLQTLNGLPGPNGWAIKGGGAATSDDETRGIAVDDAGNPCVTGFLYPGAPNQFASDAPIVLVASYSSAGVLRWTRNAINGLGVPNMPADIGLGIAVDRAGCVHVTGAFTEDLEFPPVNSPVATLNANPGNVRDMFVAKMCPTCGCENLNHNLSTGLDNANGTLTAFGQPDDCWVITDKPAGAGGPATPFAAVVVPPIATWLGPFPGSQWISVSATHGPAPNGFYTNRYCFWLDRGASNAVLDLWLRADDQVADVILNGTSICGICPGGVFNGPALHITTAAHFLPGQSNCLEVVVQDSGGVAVGLDVAGTVTAANGQCCARICGMKFKDLNNNGVKDPSEPGVQGFTIVAMDASGNVVGAAVTDGQGNYCIEVPAPGSYTVSEVQQPPQWVQTTLQNVPVNATGPLTYNVNFGNRLTKQHGQVVRQADDQSEIALRVSGLPEITSVSQSGGTLTITWTGGAPSYSLQTRSSLTSSWSTIASGLSGPSTTARITDSMGFYRISSP